MNSTARTVLIVVAAVVLIYIFRKIFYLVFVIGLIALAALLFYTIMRLKN